MAIALVEHITHDYHKVYSSPNGWSWPLLASLIKFPVNLYISLLGCSYNKYPESRETS